jgi:hypothetical protein
MDEIRTITLEKFQEMIEIAGGKAGHKRDIKFICPNCGNTQSYNDFLKLGGELNIDMSADRIMGLIHFSCIGRLIPGCKGEIGNKIKPCNYTSGGLFRLNKLFVENGEKEPTPVFEIEGWKWDKELRDER